mmetsp:Transcript_2219/g.3302  ORF Transcript_2219/g.3302 Transcript_2219/m.3302 type:complete len:222 (-) Transcript_2219:60-725(-)
MGVNNGNVFDKLMGDETLKEYYMAEEKYLTHHQHQLQNKLKKRKNMKSVKNSKGNSANADLSKAHISINDQGDEFKEEFSSGDEDHLDVYNNTRTGEQGEEVVLDGSGGVDLDHHNPSPFPFNTGKEPLFPLGMENGGTNTQSNRSDTAGKLAFNFRKCKWFDEVTAQDRAMARSYLRNELRSLKKKDVVVLTNHLKKLQRREKRRVEIEKGKRERNGNGK